MLLKIGAALAAVPLAMAGVVAGTGVVVVDVRPSDGPHIVVPVPLILAETAGHLAPVDKTERAFRGLDRAQKYLPLAEDMLKAIEDAPDFEMVRVEDDNEDVRISKVGHELQIRVHDDHENVSVNVPLRTAREILAQARNGRHLDPGEIIASLRSARMTNLVEVEGRDEHVKISVW
jgi:hypothetical protein